jgi:hypothetical protein
MRTSGCLLALLHALIAGPTCFAQPAPQQTPSLPLNASVSNFGTSFVFGPQPVCRGCVETELGFASLEEGRFLPAVVSVSPLSNSTDFSVLVNVLDSQVLDGNRTTHFGNRFDFVVRQRVLQRGGLVLSIAPRGVVFTRDLEGGRIGGTVAAQYGKGRNLGVLNVTFTGGLGGDSANPASNYQGAFDFYRTLSETGFAVFVGILHDYSTGNTQSVSTEAGLIFPFRNGQVELSSQQLNLDTDPAWQLQARVTVNWGRVFGR